MKKDLSENGKPSLLGSEKVKKLILKRPKIHLVTDDFQQLVPHKKRFWVNFLHFRCTQASLAPSPVRRLFSQSVANSHFQISTVSAPGQCVIITPRIRESYFYYYHVTKKKFFKSPKFSPKLVKNLPKFKKKIHTH